MQRNDTQYRAAASIDQYGRSMETPWSRSMFMRPYGKRIAEETDKWAKVIKFSGAKAN
jgi:hypothetical protein